MKRFVDVIVSSIALLLLMPLMVVIACWIRIDSKGPILFKQRRLGKKLVVFRILKFRTMVDRDPDSIDQISERVLTTGHDARITTSGKFLRATSLDELPQLINVLRGEMSLVGPRPLLEAQLLAIPKRYFNRFDVIPGITGLAQVRGRRGLDWLEQLEADSEYAKRPSFSADLNILFSTARAVFKRQGVYADENKNWRAYLPNGHQEKN